VRRACVACGAGFFSHSFQEIFLLRNIKFLSSQRWPWLLLVVVAAAFEGGALYLQHALHVEPCNECIYIRAGVAAMGLAGVIGALAPGWLVVRLAGLAVWFGALGWSLYRATLLLDLERIVREGGEGSCARFKGFPEWMPLEQWLPNVFEPRAMCGDVNWTFLGQSVTFWIWASMWFLALVASLVLLAQFDRSKRLANG
jgi:disulfide bond formation protein DsbB